jgi:hypothetical protein
MRANGAEAGRSDQALAVGRVRVAREHDRRCSKKRAGATLALNAR